MGDLKAKIRTKLFRRSSASPSSIITTSSTAAADDPHHHLHHPPSSSSPASSPGDTASQKSSSRPRKSRSFKSLRSHTSHRRAPSFYDSKTSPPLDLPPPPPPSDPSRDDRRSENVTRPDSVASGDLRTLESSFVSVPSVPSLPPVEGMIQPQCPALTLERASPPEVTSPKVNSTVVNGKKARSVTDEPGSPVSIRQKPALAAPRTSAKEPRKQYPVTYADAEVVHQLPADDDDAFRFPNIQTPRYIRHVANPSSSSVINAAMLHRKVWVKRPNTSATIVSVKEDDLVDEVKDSIITKFRNSLGRQFDAPDVLIKISARDRPGDRILNPDEVICKVLDSYFPHGQSIEEALTIEVPSKVRTPRLSPRAAHQYQSYHAPENEERPQETGTDYFPPMPPTGQMSPSLPNHGHDSRHGHNAHGPHDRAMSVLTTGYVPPLPSPGSTRRPHTHTHLSRGARPGYNRQQTSSPTALTNSVHKPSNRPRLDSAASAEKVPHSAVHAAVPPPAPPIPTPPPAADGPKTISNPPTPRVSSPRPSKARKIKQKNADPNTAIPPNISVIDTAVPPINVLIVEDNHINMKLLEQFIRRLKVRWQTAVNGREAVDKWRMGSYHLILMDIQLPIMSGLEATKEIRRLERVNNIGAFNETRSDDGAGDADGASGSIKDEDRLQEPSKLFKSPVIIVALTASNLQSDRHEALAAGCNDFLTKPVNFVWFERKVKEWGCMQALIDFDGWRNWKDYAAQNGLKDASVSNPKAANLPARGKKAALEANGGEEKKKEKEGEGVKG